MGRYDEVANQARAAGLTIGEPRAWTHARALPASEVIAAALGGDGYLELPGVIPPALIAQCRAAIELAVGHGAPPVCAFAFDALWQLIGLLTPIAARGLGRPVEVLDSIWAWHVAGEAAKGWPPHRDRPTEAFTPERELASLTLWVAISDATVRNGCLTVVPAPWDYEYNNPLAREHVSSMQHIRALPATAGTVLGWTHALLHWGTAAAANEPARISVGFEFVRAGYETNDERFPADIFPGLADRCAIIGNQIPKYRHMHELSDDTLAPASPFLGALRRAFD